MSESTSGTGHIFTPTPGTRRVMADCRQTPSLKNCSVKITGTAEEVAPLVLHHMVADHGHEDNQELRDMIFGDLEHAQLAPEND